MLFRNLLVAASVSSAQIFSFEEWIQGKVANPDGDNLSPEEAVAAWEVSFNDTENYGLEKRATCNRLVRMEAPVSDAVWCIDYLAQRGARGVSCRTCDAAHFCRHGGAHIVGVSGGGVSCSSTNCNNVARAAGKIMDQCTRADGMVQGVEMVDGAQMAVHVSKPEG